MAVLVYTENWDGKFKKLSYELISYATKLAETLNTSVVALSIGNVDEAELRALGQYGASKVLAAKDGRLGSLENKAFASVIAQAAEKEQATVVVFAHNFTGKAVAPRVAVRLKAGLAAGVAGLPQSTDPFIVPKKAFNGSSFANLKINTPIRVLTLFQNSFGILEKPAEPTIESFEPTLNDSDFATSVKDVNKVTGKILLTDAEIVVSAGRGMKSPENWAPLEQLAETIGAALACSRPVSDEGWRPHEEHVGQTGKVIAPNLYFAVGISGAIQHVAGVSSSKFIVAINKDKDAPIFDTAAYGVIGDAMQVLPALTAAFKEFKASN
ncbi:MAG: electron transfer flavoprotein subunit alpha/FixB family protein [Bacteroidetes bacterium]|nr:electron transfer flavoprotein subunit alpha/FixB family protein [Bacteroidota bacterium]MBU1719679.1 electron transfer flavoprotein subunit alpha/FixB family protein [Bacteroidota bacterium]